MFGVGLSGNSSRVFHEILLPPYLPRATTNAQEVLSQIVKQSFTSLGHNLQPSAATLYSKLRKMLASSTVASV